MANYFHQLCICWLQFRIYEELWWKIYLSKNVKSIFLYAKFICLNLKRICLNAKLICLNLKRIYLNAKRIFLNLNRICQDTCDSGSWLKLTEQSPGGLPTPLGEFTWTKQQFVFNPSPHIKIYIGNINKHLTPQQ